MSSKGWVGGKKVVVQGSIYYRQSEVGGRRKKLAVNLRGREGASGIFHGLTPKKIILKVFARIVCCPVSSGHLSAHSYWSSLFERTMGGIYSGSTESGFIGLGPTIASCQGDILYLRHTL